MTSVRDRATPDARPAGGPQFTAAPRDGIAFSTFRSLRHRDYRYLWIGLVFTSSGMWMEQVITGWLVYSMTGSPLLVGVASGLRSLPFLVLGPLAGVAGDRMDRKMLMMRSQMVVLGLYAAMTVLLLLGIEQVWHVFAFTLVTGLAWTLNQPVRQAVVPTLVPRDDMVNAVALQSVAFNSTRVVGPVIGGLLMVAIGPGLTFLVASLTWIGVLWCTEQVRIPASAGRGGDPAGVWADLLAGFRYAAGNNVVRTMLGLVLVPVFFAMPMFFLLPVVADQVFGGDVRVVGELMAANGAGSVLAALWVAARRSKAGDGHLLLGSGLVMGASVLAFSLSSNYPFALAMSLMMGIASMVYFILNNTLLQTSAAPEYQGRMISIYMLSRGFMPVGSALCGGIAEITGVAAAIGAGGVITLVLLTALLVTLGRTPAWRELGQPRADHTF